MSSYVSNGELHISLGSEEWTGYCEFLKKRLEELEGQKKAIEDKIAEIHKVLYPTVNVEDVDEDEEEVSVATEKYLLIKDVAAKYKVTEQSVLAACQTGKVPCHKVGDEYRFTSSDMERLTSLMARKKLFTPAPVVPAPKPIVETVVIADSGKKISSIVAYGILGVNWYGGQRLREEGLLKGVQDSKGSNYLYDEKEVLALKARIKEAGGVSNLLSILSGKKDKYGAGDICNMLHCTMDEYKALRNKGFLVNVQTNTGRGKFCYYDKAEVDALEEMVKAEGGIKPFLKKARA